VLLSGLAAGQSNLRLSLGGNLNPYWGHTLAAEGSNFSNNFHNRPVRFHYSLGPSVQLTGHQAFAETAVRWDRHTALMYQLLDDGDRFRHARVQYTAASVPLLLGVRLQNNTNLRYELFAVGGAWVRWYEASSMWYASRLRRRLAGSVGESGSNFPGAIWQQHKVVPPELNRRQQEHGLELGFRLRIRVKRIGRIEYGMTYEYALDTREALVIESRIDAHEPQVLVPRANAVRVNLAYNFLGWKPREGWKRTGWKDS